METYSFLREFADSWMLLFLFCFFAGVVLWVFRPGASKEYDDTAQIPFRHAEKPASVQAGAPTAALDADIMSADKEART